MLRTLRITLAALSFIFLTLLFLDFTGTLRHYAGWLARIQFIPALLALNVGIVVALVLLTLLLGRVYCSVICPLGIFQDLAAWFAGKGRKKKPFHPTPAHPALRYSLLALFGLLLLAGLMPLASLIEPYSAWGRISMNLLAPLYRWGNNGLAYFAEHSQSYAFYSVEVWLKSAASLAVALLTLAIIGGLAARGGRTWCNTACPVGTLLGLLSRFALFRPVINLSKCTGCRLCERACKASCIDAKAHQIDYSRCVACMNCVAACNQSAMRFTRARRNQPQPPETANS